MGIKNSHKSNGHTTLFISDHKSGSVLILKLIQAEICENWYQGISIPKQLASLEEKYLRRCFERIHINALQLSSCPVFVDSSSLDTGLVSDNTSSKFAATYPMAVRVGDLVSSSEDEGIVGSFTESNSMMSILSSPLFQKLGFSDNDARVSGTKLFENKRSVASDHQGSPGQINSSPSHKPGKEIGFRNQGYRDNSVLKGPIYESRLGVGLTMDHQSYGCSSSQGMLQCTWDNEIPHFTFSLDNQKELYVANAAKAEAVHGKVLDYVYYFHLKANGQKSSDVTGIESDPIGKMKVSTSFSLCSCNSKIMVTEFVLVGTNDYHATEIHSLSRNHRHSRKLSKVIDMFKAGPSHKHRSPYMFDGSSVLPEEFSTLESDFLPNLELAAIVVKDHLQTKDHQEEIGGWGLKFLKKSMVKPIIDSLDVSATSKCYQCSSENCSTSMDIILPAGPHGGPRTKVGGPSSLMERWRSTGHCDCGGWDIGCPLKVLKARQRSEAGSGMSESQGECRSFDIFIEGSEKATPSLKLVNIRDGLYFVSFQSTLLSALQCFTIAVATIHSKTPSLSPKQVQS